MSGERREERGERRNDEEIYNWFGGFEL